MRAIYDPEGECIFVGASSECRHRLEGTGPYAPDGFEPYGIGWETQSEKGRVHTEEFDEAYRYACKVRRAPRGFA